MISIDCVYTLVRRQAGKLQGDLDDRTVLLDIATVLLLASSTIEVRVRDMRRERGPRTPAFDNVSAALWLVRAALYWLEDFGAVASTSEIRARLASGTDSLIEALNLFDGIAVQRSASA